MIQSAHLITSRLCSITTNRVPGLDQALEQLQQNRDIIEMQSGRWFVENKKIAACRHFRLFRFLRRRRVAPVISEVANEF